MFITKVTKGNSFLKSNFSNKKYCIVAFICKEYNLLAYNWYLHLKKIGLGEYALLVCLDIDSYTYSRQNNIPSIYLDQEQTIHNLKDNPFSNAWRLPPHVCQSQLAYLLTQDLNLDVIRTDVDMIFMKESFVNKVYESIDEGYDTCIYTNGNYGELSKDGLVESVSKNGGMMLLWTKDFIKKLLYNVQNGPELVIDVPDKHITLQDIGKAFNINAKLLHPFLFTNTTFWRVKEVRKAFQDIAYSVHYNMLCDVTILNKIELSCLSEQKINIMKECGQWLVDCE